jgi:hypothetical protein
MSRLLAVFFFAISEMQKAAGKTPAALCCITWMSSPGNYNTAIIAFCMVIFYHKLKYFILLCKFFSFSVR